MLTDQSPEDGFTLVELVVSMSILLVVLGALLSVLESGMSAEARSSRRIDDQQAVALTLAQLTRDVRGATDLGPGTTPPAELDLTEVDGTQLRWVYETAGGRLVRYVGTTPGVSLGGVGGGTAFTLFDAAGEAMTAGVPYTPADLIHCAATVEATVSLADGVTETAAAPLTEVPLDTGGSAVAGVAPAGRWPGCP